MAFQFRLESVQVYRSSLEEKAQLRLAREQRLLDNHSQHLEGLKVERQEMINGFEARKTQVISSALFAVYAEAIAAKERSVEEQQRVIASQRHVVEECRRELARRMQERKVIERIREKKYKEYIAETLKKEQTVSDEQAVIRHGRKWHG